MRQLLALRCVSALILIACHSPSMALDLLGAWRQAVDNDPNYLAAQADAQGAEANTRAAFAGFLPAVGLSASRFNATTDQTVNTILGPRDSSSTYLSKNESITIRQPLLRYDRYTQYRQAKAQEIGAQAGVDAERQNLALRLTTAYLDVLAALDSQKLVAAQKEAYSGQYELAERAFASGTGTRTDVDDARARRDLVAANEIEVANLLDTALRTLASVVGKEVPAIALASVRTNTPLKSVNERTLADWMQQVTDANSELRYAEQQVEAARHEVARMRSGHWPTIDLVAAQTRSQSDTVTSIGQFSDTRQVGVQVNIPLFSGGQTNAGVDQALARLERSKQQLESTRRRLVVNVGKAYDQVRHGRARIAAGETALASATQAVVSTQKGIQAGTRNSVDLLNAQQQEASARRELARARYDFLASQLNLKLMAGVPGEDAITSLNVFFSNT